MKKSIFLLTLLCLTLPLSVLFSCHKEERYDVIYMVEGQQYSKLTTSGNRTFPLPPDPVRKGFIFQGWYFDEDYYLEKYDNTAWENSPLLTNITVYAKWKRDGACPVGECIPGEISVIKAPTCTEKGVEQAVCTVCEEVISRYIPMLDHVEAEEKQIQNETPPTCAKEGSYDEVTVCRDCGKELSRETHSVATISHIAKTAVWEKIHDSTCTTDGSYDSVVYCRDCDAELSRETGVIEKKPHSADTNVCSICQTDFLIYEYSETLGGYIVTGTTQNTYKTIVIPNKHNGKTVCAIGAGAFRGCTSLQKVEIPFSIQYIYEEAFADCASLQKITYYGKKEEWEAIYIAPGNDPLTAITPYFNNNFTEWMPFGIKP